MKLYIIQNMLEALGVIAYTHRSPQHVAGRLGKASTKGGDSIRRLAGVSPQRATAAGGGVPGRRARVADGVSGFSGGKGNSS
ncbi:MAG: hypothetical protein JNL11_05500 [Bdellovibrionaceae bacterium]|nr:hypothetical protein [Pseudobdellovibrionaceae bacterium]